jgi:protein-S-isoprenylcysteine O-methyltransferase Ste14
MFFRALLAFLILPGVAALLVPPLLVAFDPWKSEFMWQGCIVMLIGLGILLWCVRDFHVLGMGTLAPWDPPKHLVVAGLYRHMRNPMYAGVLTLVTGWSVLFASPMLGIYAVVLAIGFHIRVLINEEPWLASQFGNDWSQYCSNVNRWLPRIKPWSVGSEG